MTDIHDIKPLLSPPFPWLAAIVCVAVAMWLFYKLKQRLAMMKKAQLAQKPILVPAPPKPIDYTGITVKELRNLSTKVDKLYQEQKEPYIYALISYWLRFFLEHHSKHAALTLTKQEIQEHITTQFEAHLSECYRIEFAKQSSDVEKTKAFIDVLIKDLTAVGLKTK